MVFNFIAKPLVLRQNILKKLLSKSTFKKNLIWQFHCSFIICICLISKFDSLSTITKYLKIPLAVPVQQ